MSAKILIPNPSTTAIGLLGKQNASMEVAATAPLNRSSFPWRDNALVQVATAHVRTYAVYNDIFILMLLNFSPSLSLTHSLTQMLSHFLSPPTATHLFVSSSPLPSTASPTLPSLSPPSLLLLLEPSPPPPLYNKGFIDPHSASSSFPSLHCSCHNI